MILNECIEYSRIRRKCLFLLIPLLESENNTDKILFKCVSLIKKHVSESSTRDAYRLCKSMCTFIKMMRKNKSTYSENMKKLYYKILK